MDVLATLRARGFIKQITHEEELGQALASGPMTVYAGFDPSADSMHAGHLLPVLMLRWFQKAGHRVIAVVGGGTGRVGDPTGRTELRKVLSEEQIAKNIEGLRGQLGRFLVLDGERGLLVDNSSWLMELGYIDFLRDIGRHFSVNRMLASEAYKQRMARGLSFLEFNYQILQAYDFLELFRSEGCTVQLGGDDQWGNIVAGVDLIRRVTSGQAYGVTLPLLTTATGAKMGKTAKGAVWLDANRLSPFDYYQYWLNADDRDVAKFLRLFTDLDLERIEELGALQGADIRKAKAVLAFEATAMVHGAEAAEAAQTAGKAMVSGDAAADIPSHTVDSSALAEGIRVYVVLADAGMVKSRGEGRRLIKGGGVKLNGDKVTDPEADLTLADVGDGAVLRIGKKRALRVVAASTGG